MASGHPSLSIEGFVYQGYQDESYATYLDFISIWLKNSDFSLHFSKISDVLNSVINFHHDEMKTLINLL
jgi:hypothetical protein